VLQQRRNSKSPNPAPEARVRETGVRISGHWLCQARPRDDAALPCRVNGAALQEGGQPIDR